MCGLHIKVINVRNLKLDNACPRQCPMPHVKNVELVRTRHVNLR
jgi:hypothetical protein